MQEAPAKRRGRPPKIKMSDETQSEPEALPVMPVEPEPLPVLSGPVELPASPLTVSPKIETIGPVDIIDIEEAPTSPVEAARPIAGKMFWFGETAVFELDGPANRLKITRGHHRITDPAQIELFTRLSTENPSLKIFPES